MADPLEGERPAPLEAIPRTRVGATARPPAVVVQAVCLVWEVRPGRGAPPAQSAAPAGAVREAPRAAAQAVGVAGLAGLERLAGLEAAVRLREVRVAPPARGRPTTQHRRRKQ